MLKAKLKCHASLMGSRISAKTEFPKHKPSAPTIDNIMKTAHLLIKKPKDMQTEAGLLNAVELLRNNKDKLRSIRVEE